MEAAPGFEPGNKGFAVLCLTTWLCRHRKSIVDRTVRGCQGRRAFAVARRLPDRHTLSITFVEVSDHLAEALPDLERAYDFLWFTPRVDDLDPCERFKKELEKMRPGEPSAR